VTQGGKIVASPLHYWDAEVPVDKSYAARGACGWCESVTECGLLDDVFWGGSFCSMLLGNIGFDGCVVACFRCQICVLSLMGEI